MPDPLVPDPAAPPRDGPPPAPPTVAQAGTPPLAQGTVVQDGAGARPDAGSPPGYELLEEVARGGMGIVYRARQVALDRAVAVKVILSAGDPDPSGEERFRAEATAAGRLDHPHIVPVYDYGRAGGRPFLVMGFVPGRSLAARLKEGGPLPAREAAGLVRKAAGAVAYAHDRGIVHRDLKPGNILLDEAGEPRVTDFGLAKLADASRSLTGTGQVLGTPAYMAPEQAAGDPDRVGPAADVYALGATLYALLTGRPPFEAASIPELLVKLAEEDPVPPRRVKADVHRGLEAVCLRCLRRDPGARYPSAAALADDLDRWLAGRRVRAFGARRRRVVVGLVAGLVLAAGAVAGWRALAPPRPVADPAAAEAAADRAEVLVAAARDGRADDPGQVVARWEEALAAARETAPGGPARDRLRRAEQEAAAGLAAARRVLDEARQDEAFATAVRAAADALAPDDKAPWEYRYAAAADALKKAFADHGLAVLDADVVQVAAAVRGRSARYREAAVGGLEAWELCATAAKAPDPDHLRQVQAALDAVPWRIALRQARAAGDGPAIAKAVAQTAAEALGQSPTRDQAEVVALAVLVHAPGKDGLDVLRQLQRADPGSYWLGTHLAAGYYAAGRAAKDDKRLFGSAVAPLREASQARPTSPLPHRQLAELFRALGNLSAAEAESERGDEKAFPDGWRLLTEARRLRAARKYDEAAAVAGRAAAAAPDLALAHLEVGIAHLRAGRPGPAEDAFRQTVLKAESDVRAVRLMRVPFQVGDGDEPAPADPLRLRMAYYRQESEAWRRVGRYRPDLSALRWANLAYRLIAPDELDERLAAREEAARREPQDRDFLYALGADLAFAGRKLDRAEAVLRQSLAAGPDRYWEHEALARALTAAGKHAAATDEYRAALRHARPAGQEFAMAWFADNLIRTGGADAAAGLEPFVHATGWGPRALALQAWAQAALGREAEADRLARAAAARFPQGGNAWLVAVDLARAGRPEDGLRYAVLDHLLRDGAFSWAPSGYALAAVRTGDLDGAQAAAAAARRVALDRLPADLTAVWDYNTLYGPVMACAALGRAHLAAGDVPAALAALRDAYELEPFERGHAGYPGGPEGYSADYAVALLMAGRAEEAERVARDAAGRRPFQGAARQAVGQVLLAKGKAAEAAEELRAAERNDPLDGLAGYHLGRALLAAGDADGAAAAFERAIAQYRKRRLRMYQPVPAAAAVALLDRPAGPPGKLARAAVGWLTAEAADWRARVEGGRRADLVTAAQVLDRLLKSETAKAGRSDALLARLPADARAAWSAAWAELDRLRAEAVRKRGPVAPDLADRLWPQAREREAAEWVLQSGGAVLVLVGTKQFQRIASSGRLPAEPFRLFGASLSGRPVGDADLDRLADLLILRDVYLDGTQVTDAGVARLLARAPTVARLSLEGTGVTDAVVPALGPLPEVFVRRTRITPAAAAGLATASPPALVLHDSTVPPRPKRAGGFALRFDGSGWVELPLEHEVGKPMTLEATIVLGPELHDEYMPVVGCWGKDCGFVLDVMRPGRARGSVFEPNDFWRSSDASDPAFRIALLERVHVAACYDGKLVRCFVDGRLIHIMGPGKLAVGSKARLNIGCHRVGNRTFVGTIDEVRVSSAARYTTDFKPAARLGADADTLGLYHLDEGAGDVARDASGRDNHGKIRNGRWVPAE